MAFSRNSAIGRFKAACRQIKRDRKAGKPSAAPPLEAVRVHVDRSGGISVIAANGAIRAAGFDSREEAQAWIDAR